MSPKQQRFIEEYLVDLNATQAAIRAGYSERTARQIATKLLSIVHIQEAIQAKRQKLSVKTEITVERVINALGAIAFGDIRNLFGPGGELIAPADLSDEAAALLAGIDVVTVSKGEGEVEHIAKVKTNDRIRALELLGKHLGAFTDKVDLTVKGSLSSRLIEARRRVRDRK